ncbi:MAG: ABA4-like family protein [Flavobacteriales bacterium]
MNPDVVYSIVNTIALVAWIALSVAPYNARVQEGALGGVVVMLAVLYAVLFIGSFNGAMMKELATLDGLMGLFSNKQALVLGWTHYLAFDLVAGIYIVRNAQTHEVSSRAIIPFLWLTFMAGPLGWLTYVIFRVLKTKKYEF